MKNIINKQGLTLAICLVFLFGFTTAKAQSGEKTKGGFGVKGGVALSTIGFNNEDASEHKNRFRVGGTAGLSYEVPSAGFFAFEIDALYDLRGTKEEATLLGGNEIVQKNYLHYISFPASFKFYIGDNFNLNFGPYAAALAGGKAQYTLYSPSGEVVEEKDFKLTGQKAEDINGNTYLKKFDAGLHFGLEFISDSGIGVGSSFSKGLVDITHDDHIIGNGNATTTELNIYMLFRL